MAQAACHPITRRSLLSGAAAIASTSAIAAVPAVSDAELLRLEPVAMQHFERTRAVYREWQAIEDRVAEYAGPSPLARAQAHGLSPSEREAALDACCRFARRRGHIKRNLKLEAAKERYLEAKEAFNEVMDEIAFMQASTIAGLSMKARLCNLGDYDGSELALSIAEDLLAMEGQAHG